MRSVGSSFGALLVAIGIAGCTLNSTVGAPSPSASAKTSANPIIQSFTANPSSGGTWDQTFTFSVTAYSPAGDVLAYSWSSTGGTLSSTNGQVTSWTPPKTPGTYTVQVAIADPTTGGQAVGATNLTISASGSVSETVQ